MLTVRATDPFARPSEYAKMSSTHQNLTQVLPPGPSCHPDDPIPQEPENTRKLSVTASSLSQSLPSATSDHVFSDDGSSTETTATSHSDSQSDDSLDDLRNVGSPEKTGRKRRASTLLVSQNSEDLQRLLSQPGSSVEMIQKACCGGGCCMLQELESSRPPSGRIPVSPPNNAAYRALNVRLGHLSLDSELSGIVDLPQKTTSFEQISSRSASSTYPDLRSQNARETRKHPPNFVKPHPPYDVYSAPLYHARELTRSGAEKRTYHFDLDVTDYPEEGGDVDFVVGGAVGVCAPNDPRLVDQVFDRLGIPKFIRDRPVLLKTTTGRWPTIWGDDEAREVVTTRRELLTWCSDIQSYPPTKQLLRLLAEHSDDEHEKQILTYLSSAHGQAAFCDLRTGPYITLVQLLTAFPSSRPPFDHLLSCLNQLMPRFYSLSQDPLVSTERNSTNSRRIIEVAVTVHEASDWDGTQRTGVGSGYLERLARQIMTAEKEGRDPNSLDLRVPMFRGLMANPLAREFVSDGPMLLIGAGVGIAPFRGFVHRRLKSANCANKVWVLQGVRDSLLDELYSGDWGVHEDKVKKVVQSRRGEGRYVQEEVRAQADLVWFIINALDGRVFVCGSSQGMGEGVERALVDVAMGKGGLNEEQAREFWDNKKEGGQYIAETW